MSFQLLCDDASSILLEHPDDSPAATKALVTWFEQTDHGRHYLAQLDTTDAGAIAHRQVADARRLLPGRLLDHAREGHVRLRHLAEAGAQSPDRVVGLDPMAYEGKIR